MGACASALDKDKGLGPDYSVVKHVGGGTEGEVYLCTRTSDEQPVAVKLVSENFVQRAMSSLQWELQVHAQLQHVNIISMKQVRMTKSKQIAIVMEYLGGGDLHDYSDRHRITEPIARYFLHQILSAVEYCHSRNVVHRDLKLQNFILDNANPPRVKLADFGCAKKFKELPKMKTMIGTPGYMSPEILDEGVHPDGTYDGTKSDIWACGIMLVHMFFGFLPFWNTQYAKMLPGPRNRARLQAMQGSTRWWETNKHVKKGIKELSPECQDLLDKIFTADEDSRLTIEEIREHPWFNVPLPHVLQLALEEMEEEQNDIDSKSRSVSATWDHTSHALDQIVGLAAGTVIPPKGAAPEVVINITDYFSPDPSSRPSVARMADVMLLSPAGSAAAAAGQLGDGLGAVAAAAKAVQAGAGPRRDADLDTANQSVVRAAVA